MKKCATILFFSALFFLFSCNKGKGARSASSFENTIITADTIKICEKEYFTFEGDGKPTLKIDMRLPIVKLANEKATERMDSILAIALFQERTTLREACSTFVEKEKKDFDEARNEYFNSSEEDILIGYFSRYHDINATALNGCNRYISYFTMHEEYYGGAHPNTYISIVNFDPETGEQVTLDDIFIEGYEAPLTQLLLAELMENVQANTMDELREKGFLFLDAEMFVPKNFFPEENGITFLYNRYDIAPYAYGEITLTIDYEKLKEIMK